MYVAVSSASPRGPFNATVPETARSSVAITVAGFRRAGTVLASSSSVVRPAERRRGHQRASGLYRVTTTNPTGNAFVPVCPPSSSTRQRVCVYEPGCLRPSGAEYGCTRPRSSSTAYSSE